MEPISKERGRFLQTLTISTCSVVVLEIQTLPIRLRFTNTESLPCLEPQSIDHAVFNEQNSMQLLSSWQLPGGFALALRLRAGRLRLRGDPRATK